MGDNIKYQIGLSKDEKLVVIYDENSEKLFALSMAGQFHTGGGTSVAILAIYDEVGDIIIQAPQFILKDGDGAHRLVIFTDDSDLYKFKVGKYRVDNLSREEQASLSFGVIHRDAVYTEVLTFDYEGDTDSVNFSQPLAFGNTYEDCDDDDDDDYEDNEGSL